MAGYFFWSVDALDHLFRNHSQTLGELYSERVALKVAPSILLMTRILSVVWLFGTHHSAHHASEPISPPMKVKFVLAQIGLDEGVIEDDEAKMLQQVFKLNDTTAKDLMTPRIAMTYLNGGDALRDAKDFIINSQHSRLIVVEDTPDNVLGFALKSQLLALINGDGSEPFQTTIPVQKVSRALLQMTCFSASNRARSILQWSSILTVEYPVWSHWRMFLKF